MQPLVSVIITTYKGFDKIGRAVESVFNQTYQNIEIIVVDDNGVGTESQILTQNSLLKYIENKKFFYIAHEENKNGSAARNTGMRQAKGEYFCFLDDDDVFLPQKIELQIEKFKNLSPEYGMVFGSVEEIVSDNVIWYHKAKFKGDFLYLFFLDKINACSSTVMIRASVLEKVKEWDESFKRHQDWEFFARVANFYKVSFVLEPCIKKYKYDNNLPKDGKKAEEYREHYLQKMKPIIEKYGKRKATKIYDHHFRQVGKIYIKNRDIKNAIRIARKTNSPFFTICIYIRDGIRYIFRRR